MKILLTFLSLSVIHVCHCQTKEEKNKLENLAVQSEEAVLKDINSARALINQGLRLSEEGEFNFYEAKFKNILGRYFLRMSQIDSAECEFRFSLNSIKDRNCEELKSSVLLGLGSVKQKKNELDSALYYYELSWNASLKVKDFEEGSKSLINSAVIYRARNNYSKAIGYLQKCLDLTERYNFDKNDDIRSFALANLGSNFFAINDYDKSMKYYREALSIFAKNEASRELILVIDNIIVLLELKGELEGIEELLLQMDKHSSKVGHPDLLVITKNAQANYAARCGNYNECAKLAREGLELAKQFNDRGRVYSLQYSLGRSLFKLGKPAESIPYLLDAEKGGRKVGKSRYVVNILNDLAESYQAIGQPDLAYKHLKESIDLQDSLIPVEKQRTMQRLEVQFQTKLLKKDN